ncbi:MAG: hypothetical protein PWP23_2575 [Candidatus Sumerlaeota bacterium]|nr:hypothetical protein [Candidatus Sumerlaeota bacterium]
MSPGIVFLGSAFYLTLAVALVISLLDVGLTNALTVQTLRRWGKFLLGLAILAMVVQILTLLS